MGSSSALAATTAFDRTPPERVPRLPDHPDADDVTLVQRMAAGEPTALEALHRRHAPMLQALVLRLLRNPEDAQDAVQEVFAQAWRLAPRYQRTLASVSTWLGMMARSRALDCLRRRRIRPESPLILDTEEPLHTEPARGTERVLQNERRARVRIALSCIPPCQRRVLELRFWEGLTQTEIAEEIGIPLGTVKTRTLLALKKLREGLGEELQGLL